MFKRTKTFISNLESLETLYPPPFNGMLTTESIAFQKNDMFGPRLEAVIQKYKDLIDSGVKKVPLKNNKGLHKELEEVIFSRLGIKVSIHVNTYLAATVPNVYIPHNPVINKDIRWIYDILDTQAGQGKLKKQKPYANLGTVNTETAKVTGWFSEQIVPVYMNFYELFKDMEMTVPEVTAILLHELGHDFNGILFSANINTTNQIIADIVKHITETDRGGDVKYVYAKIKDVYPKASVDIAEGLMSGDKVVMNVAAYRLMVGATQSLMSESSYDRNSFEALADNFASRFGYSLALITGLEKLEKLYPEYSRMVEHQMSVLHCSIVLAIAGIGFAIAAISGGGAAVLFGSFMSFMFLWLTAIILNTGTVTGKDMTYDGIRDRYARIRLQMVELIKDEDLEASVKETLLDQISVVDAIISEKRMFTGVIERFSRIAIPKDRRAFASIELQQEIEKLIANDIFVSANRLALRS